jgi:hypothetical protein
MTPDLSRDQLLATIVKENYKEQPLISNGTEI